MNALSPKHPSTVDHTLLARVAKGDQEAFERLYTQTSSLLYALVLRIVGKPADAADLLQEVYLEAWRKASNYDTARGAPMAWLVTLARSRAIDWVRALAARGKDVTASLDDTPASDLIAQNADALDIRAANERQDLVRACLTSLQPVQQQAIELAFYDGLTHTKISDRLHVPLGTIKSRFTTALCGPATATSSARADRQPSSEPIPPAAPDVVSTRPFSRIQQGLPEKPEPQPLAHRSERPWGREQLRAKSPALAREHE